MIIINCQKQKTKNYYLSIILIVLPLLKVAKEEDLERAKKLEEKARDEKVGEQKEENIFNNYLKNKIEILFFKSFFIIYMTKYMFLKNEPIYTLIRPKKNCRIYDG